MAHDAYRRVADVSRSAALMDGAVNDSLRCGVMRDQVVVAIVTCEWLSILLLGAD